MIEGFSTSDLPLPRGKVTRDKQNWGTWSRRSVTRLAWATVGIDECGSFLGRYDSIHALQFRSLLPEEHPPVRSRVSQRHVRESSRFAYEAVEDHEFGNFTRVVRNPIIDGLLRINEARRLSCVM